jgi:ubiquinone/menaquinone biosynthesis C-methylase UbiE
MKWSQTFGMDEQVDPDFLKNEAYDNSQDLDIRKDIQDSYSLRQENWFRWLYKRIKLSGDGLKLEVGCGPGDLWSDNSGELHQGFRVLLTDFSEGMVNEARRRLREIPALFSFCALDVQYIPLQSSGCQTVIANGVLDHTPDRVRTLDEIHRVLAPGGVFYTSTGSKRHLREMEELVRPFTEEANFGGAPERFGVENGERILLPWFNPVQLVRYEDKLVFSDPLPVAAYVLSEAAVRKSLTKGKRKEFLQYLQSEIDQRGSFTVKLEKGLFIAQRR